MHKVVSTDPDECACTARRGAGREGARHRERFAARFETALTKLNDGLARRERTSGVDQVWQRIGRLKAKIPRRGRTTSPSPPTRPATRPAPSPGPAAARTARWLPIRRLLPAQQRDRSWDEDALWRTYTTLTDVEAVFRSLKSARPASHRTTASLRRSVHHRRLVQILRTRLRAHGEHAVKLRPGRPSSASRPSAAPTDARDGMCARPPKPNPISGPSTTRSASTHTPAASARRSSDRPISPEGVRVCSATRPFLSPTDSKMRFVVGKLGLGHSASAGRQGPRLPRSEPGSIGGEGRSGRFTRLTNARNAAREPPAVDVARAGQDRNDRHHGGPKSNQGPRIRG